MLKAELERVEAHARAVASLGCERVEVGPFDLFFGGGGGGGEGEVAYALPARPTGEQDALRREIARVTDAFRARQLPPRVELSLLLWPELPPALAASGLVQVEDTPLFVVTPGGFRPRPLCELAVRWVAPDESPALALSIVRQGFELRGPPPSAEEVAALRVSLDGALRLATAELAGAPAGAGFSTPLATTTEISGVATLPAARRKGVAARVATFLVGEHFRHGGDLAWAVTDDPRAAALLYSLGFHDAGLRTGWMLPDGG